MNIDEYRNRIDSIDKQLVTLFCERMDTASDIAAWKKEQKRPVFDPERERQKLLEVASSVPEELREYTASLYSLLFELSRSYQNRLLGTASELTAQIQGAIDETPALFPSDASVACQGVAGAYSQIACDRLFKRPAILYLSSFDAVFSAIESGLCRYGVVPLENSTAGSVNAVYDLMMNHNFRIVRSVRIKVDHCLLVNPGTRREEIREIYSHQQAISQCEKYLQSFPNAHVIPCENTAVAAKMVAEAGRRDAAALSSHSCGKIYGLSCLESSVQDMDNNFTRFICISKKLEIYPGADRTSLMAVLPHEPGSLYKLLSRFYALGLNLNKLESRPLPNRNFEFMFYFDLETSVYSPQFLQLMGEMPTLCEEFSYLGSYSEVI
ncbi:MAG: bifunctional chorismate mutase/prephenate dehydratase [Hominicoprocola sp.]